MADGGEHIPGSDGAQSGESPLHTRPASPQAAAYEDTNPPEAASARRSWWPVCLLVGVGGCGCVLIVLLAFGIIGGVSWTLFGDGQADPPVAPIAPIAPSAPQPAPDIVEPTPDGAPGPNSEAPIDIGAPGDVPRIYQPGEEIAKEAAVGYAEQPDWLARVEEHSDDWQTATVVVGPPASEWVWEMDLRWNDSDLDYDLVETRDAFSGSME